MGSSDFGLLVYWYGSQIVQTRESRIFDDEVTSPDTKLSVGTGNVAINDCSK